MTTESPAPAAADNAADTAQSDGIAVDIDALSEKEWRALVAGSLVAGAARMDGLDARIEANTVMTKATRDDTAVIREVIETARSFFAGLNKFAYGCGRVWQALAPVVKAATVLATAYAAIRGALGMASHPTHPPK